MLDQVPEKGMLYSHDHGNELHQVLLGDEVSLEMSLSALAAITKYHRLGGLDNSCLFFTVWSLEGMLRGLSGLGLVRVLS